MDDDVIQLDDFRPNRRPTQPQSPHPRVACPNGRELVRVRLGPELEDKYPDAALWLSPGLSQRDAERLCVALLPRRGAS